MFLGERIRQAREARALTQEQLAAKIGVNKSAIAQAEGGMRMPSTAMIESIAMTTKLPLTYFDSEPHNEFPMSEILLRAHRKIKRRDVLDTVRFAEHIFTIWYFLACKSKPIPIALPNVTSTPKEAALEVKQKLGIPKDEPVEKLVHILERAGVCMLLLPPLEAREAFCVWVRAANRDIPVIAAMAGREDGDRYRLSIAHELGHLTMHRSFLRKSNQEVEEEAWAFAAEFLMPEIAMRNEIIAPFTLSSFARLKPRWGVSMAALVRRAHELRIITTRQYHYLFQQMGQAGMKAREPKNLDISVERPRLLKKLAEIHYGSPINFNKLSADTHLTAQELRAVMSEYRSTGPNEVPSAGRKIIEFPDRKRA